MVNLLSSQSTLCLVLRVRAPFISVRRHENQVVIAARREDKLQEVADEIKSAGGEAAVVAGDISKVCFLGNDACMYEAATSPNSALRTTASFVTRLGFVPVDM